MKQVHKAEEQGVKELLKHTSHSWVVLNGLGESAI